MGLNSKAVSAEGRGHSGPVEYPAHCTQYADGEGTVEILEGEVGVGKTLAVSQSKLWQWAVGASLQPRKRASLPKKSLGQRIRTASEATDATGLVCVVVVR